MKFHKFISAILHPVVMPTIGVLLYLILVPMRLSREQQLILLGIVFVGTYIIPLLLLFFLKSTGLIKDFRVHTIKERKIPLFFMIALFFGLGKTFFRTSVTRDISYLFYGTALALVLVYIIFLTKIKTSLHLLSIGSAVGFFLIVQQFYSLSILPIISVLIVFSGILATSRLYLKAHQPKEVYLGFFVGLTCQFIVYWII